MRLMKRALIVFGAWSAVALLFSIQMHFQTTSDTQPRPWGWILAWQFTGWWTFNVLVYAMIAGLYHAWRAARLEMQLVQARLDALVGQLQPHFLFNTLHTISAFVLEDPKQANRMITRLSELLRQSFNRERG